MSETRYVCPPGSDVTASTRCGVACASGELSDAECVLVAEACADGRLSAIDCEGLGGDMGVPDMSTDQGDAGDDGDVVEMGIDMGPCGGPCTTPTPLCNSVSGMCVQCLSMSDCGDGAPECDTTTGQCVQCLNAGDCGGGTPLCVSGECVQCEDSADCDANNPVCETPAQVCGNCTTRTQCFGYAALPACNVANGQCAQCDAANESADCGDTTATPRCNAAQQCVECRGPSNGDCTTPTESRCAGDSCAPCTMTAHCSHIPGRPYCNGGVCTECNPATEDTDCGTVSCNPVTRMCSGITQGSRLVCQQCVSDSDCSQADGTARCIGMTYLGTPRGGYCLNTSPGCMRPMAVTYTNVGSLSGAPAADYCGLDQALTSCEALQALIDSRACPSGDAVQCMADGARCATVQGQPNQCTVACSVANNCPGTLACTSGVCR